MKTQIIPKVNGSVLAASLCLALTSSPAFAGSIERISVDSGNLQFKSAPPGAVSDDGRYVVFNAGLVDDEPFSPINTYLRDRATGTTELVSIANDGSPSGKTSGAIDVSADGRYVVFLGQGLDGSTNAVNVYVRDRATGTTELITINDDGSPGAVNKSARGASISGDGRYVAFISESEDLVSDDNNGVPDVFVRDRINGTTQRISVASDGTQANGSTGAKYPGTDISADGRYVVFNSSASNLVPNDSNGEPDLFVHDRINNTTTRVNLSNNGSQMSAGHDEMFDLSSNGRYVVFASSDSSLVANDSNGQVDIFVRDLVANTTERVSIADDGSQTNASSSYPAISGNGRYVSFISAASNLAAGGSSYGFSVFVHDRIAQTTEMVDTPHDGSVANSFSFLPSPVSGDGRYVLFHSVASNLVAGDTDTNNYWDVFLHDRISGQICQ